MDTVYSEETNLAVSGRDAMGAAQRAVKRAFDFAVALVGLVVLSPLFLVIYVLLKRQKNGPVIFSQERIGYGGRPFTIYKFRTMSSVETAPRLTPGNGGPGSTVTERFLREHHLDELPQLWNVLKGDMSFVGPRPERKYYIDKIKAVAPEYELIYLMRPGLALQRLHRHHGENAHPSAHGLALSRNTLAQARPEYYLAHGAEHCQR